MNNSIFFEIRLWIEVKIAELLPESCKRQVLYILADRLGGHDFPWNATFKMLLETLRDGVPTLEQIIDKVKSEQEKPHD